MVLSIEPFSRKPPPLGAKALSPSPPLHVHGIHPGGHVTCLVGPGPARPVGGRVFVCGGGGGSIDKTPKILPRLTPQASEVIQTQKSAKK